ncbi:NSFL1 cofactor p47-like [Daktulosphaira vitifoliae]|uniref:NSFL1 cofactor p47-like n=1 Tax=Daktulosphaira vitifoliae TaxID=58002 RepID=UPI0021A978A5|nr:NSFL1 cofactor p47-like [Daktulosphaira vitifoliae]
MSESDNNNKINEFRGITNVDQERAKFFLESAAWNLESALASFYDEGNDEVLSDNTSSSVSRSVPASSDNPMTSSTSYKSSSKPKKWQSKSRIMTFSSMKNSEVEDKDSDEDEGQRFYAGGSITSGQQVIGPPRNNADVMTDMFQAAQKYASSSSSGVTGNPSQDSGCSTSFFGTGYKLGQTDNDTEVIHSNSSGKNACQPQEEVVLKMWKEGFTINDGELHSIEQQENREFLLLVARGEVPPLLLKEANVTSEEELHVSIEDHRFEEYTPSKPKKKLFGGSGHLLGSPTPQVVGDENINQTSSSTPENEAVNDATARAEVPLIAGAPTTSLQIRLANGSRLVATFNHSHTIGDVRRYITTARSSFATRPFILQSSYPPKALENNEQTIVDAGLLNTVIFQRFG